MAEVTPGYRWWVGDCRTGKLIRQIDLTGGRWSTDVNALGSMSGTFPLRSLEWPNVRSDTAAPKAYLAVAYIDRHGTETFLEAGPLTPGDFADDEEGNLDISGAGLGSYYGRRKLLAPALPGTNVAKTSVWFEGNEPALIVKRLIELANTHIGGNVPIVFPDDDDLGGAGSVFKKVYPGYELKWISAALKELSELSAGPEIQLVPRRRTDDPRYLEWVLRVGTAATSGLLTQSGAAWTLDRTVPESPIKSIKVSNDATRKTSRSFVAGQGDGEARLIAWSEDLTQVLENGYLLVESEVQATDTNDCLPQLQSRADADIVENARAFDYWTVVIDRDSDPNLGKYRPGDIFRIRVKDHYYIGDGEHRRRMLKMSGDTSKFVELQMAPVIGEEGTSSGQFGPDGYQFAAPHGYGFGRYGFGPYGG